MFKSPHSDQNPSEIVDFRGIFLFFVYCGAYGEMDTHTLRETSCIVQHSNRFQSTCINIILLNLLSNGSIIFINMGRCIPSAISGREEGSAL